MYHPPILWCDNNVSALALASNPVFHAKTKHLEVKYYCIKEKVLNACEANFFPYDQLTNIFTKGFPSTQLHALLTKLMGVPPISLRGM